MVGDLTSDPAGATARQEWMSDLGLWYDEPTDPADWDSVIGPLAAQIEARFNQTCCQLARTLHATGVIEGTVGRTGPVIVHKLEYYEAIARQTEAANPPGLANEFTSGAGLPNECECVIHVLQSPGRTTRGAADRPATKDSTGRTVPESAGTCAGIAQERAAGQHALLVVPALAHFGRPSWVFSPVSSVTK
ncbi:hypothetical protein FHX80_114978 [Streptomyces brevispora]|uniref:Uncharacterized protein n=2 Tax=Streptomyces brevispora TaxID=887462 RepID=A0A561V4H0_9ACTN|nr:hypothetical protein FHX80_114978 [Streptomyces brevispora]